MAEKKNKRQPLTEQTFRDLLHGVHNISDITETEKKAEAEYIAGALEASRAIFDLFRGRSDAFRSGVEVAVRLMAEVNCSADPEEYAKQEAERGNEGIRHQEDGATIALPRRVKFCKVEVKT